MERARSLVALQPHEPEAPYLPACPPRGTGCPAHMVHGMTIMLHASRSPTLRTALCLEQAPAMYDVSGSLGVLLGSASPPKPAPKSRKRGRRIADERYPMSWTGRCSLLPSPAAEPWPGARCAPPGGRSAPSTGRVSRQPPALGYAPFLPPSGLSPGRRGQDLWRPASSSSGRVIAPATTETGPCP